MAHNRASASQQLHDFVGSVLHSLCKPAFDNFCRGLQLAYLCGCFCFALGWCSDDMRKDEKSYMILSLANLSLALCETFKRIFTSNNFHAGSCQGKLFHELEEDKRAKWFGLSRFFS